MGKIFIVEDDENIRDLVNYSLRTSGYDCDGFEKSSFFWEALNSCETLPNIIILDVMLPDESGFQILKKLKSDDNYKDIPVIMLTAKGDEHDKLKGFDNGASDYIVKPFSVLELIARVNVWTNIASSKTGNSDILSYKDVIVDKAKHLVLKNNEEVILTYKEFELLCYLLANRGIVLSRDLILEKIWGDEYLGETRTIDAHIKSLRKKLMVDKDFINTVRGIGYKID